MQLHLLACALISAIQAAEIPSNFKKCNRKDANLNGCLLDAVKVALPQLDRAYPEINLPSLKPLFVAELKAKTQELLVNMDEHLYNCTFYGFPEGKPKEFHWDLENEEIRVKALFPKIESWCTYKINGRVLIFFINSSGPSHVIFSNADVEFNMSYKETVKEGETYVEIVNTTLGGNLGNVHFDIENIFPGFDLLTEFANFILNLFWRPIFEEVKVDYFDVMDKQLLRPIFEGFFKVVSLEDALD